MPRIPPSVLRQAFRISPLLPLLLPACRTVDQSLVELRWMQQELVTNKKIQKACLQRSKLIPLQYILGSQPFGELDIVCRPGVLIPRWETEEWACDLARSLRPVAGPLEVWDICAGTGCVGLLLQSILGSGVWLTAVDLSPSALSLCKFNAESNGLPVPRLIVADLLNGSAAQLQEREYQTQQPQRRINLLTCNPPYISEKEFFKETALPVRMFEPKLALVGDLEFYENLVNCWLNKVDSFVYEVGDQRQIDYVLHRISGSEALHSDWYVGQRADSRGRPRVVYGFRDDSSLKSALGGYGDLLHFPQGRNI